MDTLGSLISATNTSQMGLSMLKKGMDSASTEVAQLLQSLPPAPLPPHLGSNINTRV